MPAKLEHANYTVSDARRTARWMTDLFGWHIRWEGPSSNGGYSVHVGTDTQYVALYQPVESISEKSSSYATAGGLNHIGVVVDDLKSVEERVQKLGFTPNNHADYEPGQRFYFHDDDNIEYEVVAYT